MKTKEEIEEELKIRENIKNPASFANYRANHTIIQTLKWVLDMPTQIKSYHKKDEK